MSENREDPTPPSLPPEDPTPAGFKAKLQAFLSGLSTKAKGFSNLRGKVAAGNLSERIQSFEPLSLAEWFSNVFQKQGTAFYGKLLTIILCAFFFADLTAMLVGKYIPEAPLIRPTRMSAGPKRGKTIEDYSVIFSRNLFNSRGVIPGEEAPTGGMDLGGPPVKTTLPLNLIGTLILRDELRSIATIEDKSASQVYPVRVEDEIPSKARIIKIEPSRVIFVNTASGRREFVELPEQNLGNPRVSIGTPRLSGGGGAGVEQTSPTTFSVSRSEVDKALADINNILTQARAVPNFENGMPAGYKLFQIVPGSIYDKLGLRNGDVIVGFDGQAVNDPGKAFEAMSSLRERPRLELQVKRDGKLQTNTYDIR